MTKNKTYSIGVDIGGTNMRAVLFDGQKVIADYSLSTPREDLDQFFVMLNALIEPLLEKAKENKVNIKGVSVGVAGVVDSKKDRILETSPNLPILKNVKLASILEQKLDLPVEIDNDANSFLRGELALGAGKKSNNVYGLTIGTGVGGSWWINGGFYDGANNGASEPGRMMINMEEGKDFEKIYQEVSQGNTIELAERVLKGDEIAEEAFKTFGKYLGIAIANIINLIDPEVIVLGGGAAEVSDLYLPYTKKIMREYVMNTESKKTKIIKGKLGTNAGAIGAALLIA